MKKNNKKFDDFILKAEKISDDIVWKIYNEWLVEKIESLDFMKALINSSFINWIQNFWKEWFKQIFIILWYISILWWLIFSITELIWLFDIFNNTWFLISWIINICLGVLSIIVWFWIIKLKKRFPFITLVQWWIYILSIIVSFLAIKYYFRWFFWIWNLWHVLTNIFIFLAFYTIYIALVLKNKKLFSK